MKGVIEGIGIRACKEGATWKVRGDRTVKEGQGKIEVMGKIRQG